MQELKGILIIIRKFNWVKVASYINNKNDDQRYCWKVVVVVVFPVAMKKLFAVWYVSLLENVRPNATVNALV